MALQPANHYVITGKGIDAVIDIAGITGNPAVSLTVGAQTFADPAVTTTSQGLVVEAVVHEVPDSHTLEIRLTVPEVNVADEPVTVASFATLTRTQTSFGGPRLVAGGQPRCCWASTLPTATRQSGVVGGRPGAGAELEGVQRSLVAGRVGQRGHGRR